MWYNINFSPVDRLHSKRPLDATGIGTNEKSEKKIKKQDKQKKCLAKNKGNNLSLFLCLNHKMLLQIIIEQYVCENCIVGKVDMEL